MDGLNYISQHLSLFIFPGVFSAIRYLEAKNSVSLNNIRCIWLILSSIVLGVCWRAASIDAFGTGLSLDSLVNFLVVSIYFFTLIFLFLFWELFVFAKSPDQKGIQRVQPKRLKPALNRMGLYSLAICVLNTLLGLYCHYNHEIAQWANRHGIFEAVLSESLSLLSLTTWVLNPLLCYFALPRFLGDVAATTDSLKKCVLPKISQYRDRLAPFINTIEDLAHQDPPPQPESTSSNTVDTPDSTPKEKVESRATEGICKCPCCEHGQIVVGKDYYICTGMGTDCEFSFPMTLFGATITEDHIKDLAAGRPTAPPLFLWPKNGKYGLARITGFVVPTENGRKRFSRRFIFLD